MLGWVGYVAVVVGWFAWSPDDQYHPPLGIGDALGAMAFAGILGAPFVGVAALLVARRADVARVLVAPLLFVAGFLGFLVGAVVSVGRCTTCDDA